MVKKDAEAKKRALNVLSKNDVRYRKYTLEEIEATTDKFSESLIIGEGGYGPVYKGKLDHTGVAIKVLRSGAAVAQGKRQYQQEAMFGIYDGHGGAKATEFAAANLEKNVIDQVEKMGNQDIEAAVKGGYLMTDSEFPKEGSRGGSSCVTALIRKGVLVVSNDGDCHDVISRNGVGEALTSDHRPSSEDEESRIEALVDMLIVATEGFGEFKDLWI